MKTPAWFQRCGKTFVQSSYPLENYPICLERNARDEQIEAAFKAWAPFAPEKLSWQVFDLQHFIVDICVKVDCKLRALNSPILLTSSFFVYCERQPLRGELIEAVRQHNLKRGYWADNFSFSIERDIPEERADCKIRN